MLIDDIKRLDEGLERLENEVNRAPVRASMSGTSRDDGIETLMVFPEIPEDEAQIIYLVSSRQTFIPGDPLEAKPNKIDTYWYAAPEDTRWRPIGGKLSEISGEPGMISLRG